MKIWIVCRPCDDPYYAGHATGVVFADKKKADAYIKEKNGAPEETNEYWNSALYLEPGELK